MNEPTTAQDDLRVPEVTDSGIHRAQRNLALLVAACFFMEMLDGTIVTTSAPKIAAALHVPAGSISVVITAYLVTLAALIPLGGWLASRFGARHIFLSAIALFTLSSLGCALSQHLAELVAMRVLQGAGGAMMVPVGRLLVLARTQKRDLMRVTAYLVWPGLISPVLAPLVGGLITTYASWHWLFLINVPLGAVAFTVAQRIVPSPSQSPSTPLDVPGVTLVCGGLALLTVTAALLSKSSPAWGLDLGFGVPAVLLLAAASRHLLRANSPLIDLRTLRIPTLRTAVTGGVFYFTVIGAAPFLAPLKFEEVFGWSPVKSGALVLFIFAGNIGIKPFTTSLYGRFGFRAVLITSTATMAAAMAAIGFTTAGTPLVVIALILLLSGVARSVGATGYTTIGFVDVPEQQMRHANTLQATTQQLAGGFGVAGGAIALRIGQPLAHLLSGLPRLEATYAIAFLMVAAVALLATLDATRMQSTAGEAMRKRPQPKPRTAD
jgi:EmrB/QacA subfamily drug resistance transporter